MSAEVPPAYVQTVEAGFRESGPKVELPLVDQEKGQELRKELVETKKKLAKVGFRLGQARVSLLELEEEEDARQKELVEVGELARGEVLEHHEPALLAYHKELAAADERLDLHKQHKARSLSGVVNRVKHAFKWADHDGLIQDQQIIQKKALAKIGRENSAMSHEAQIRTWEKTNPYREGFAGGVSQIENPELKPAREKVHKLELRYTGLERFASVLMGQLNRKKP